MGERARTRSPRRGIAIAVVLIGVVAGVALIGGRDLVDFIEYDKEILRQDFEAGPSVGYRWIPRWGEPRFVRIELWSEETGFLVYQAWSDDGENRYDNYWNPDGTLHRQTVFEPGSRQEARIEPPWFEWGEDQTEPTSPWGREPAGR